MGLVGFVEHAKVSRRAASSVIADSSAAVRRRNGVIVSASAVIFQMASHPPSISRVPWVAPLPGHSGTG
jgi:hypothetical protein